MGSLLPVEIKFYPASACLSPYISGYWNMRSTSNHISSSSVFRVLPNMQSNIIFNLSETPLVPLEGATEVLTQESAYFMGAADWHQCYQLGDMVSLLGIQIRHEYLRELLRCDLHELKGQQLPLSELLGCDSDQLQQQLISEPQIHRRIAALEKVLSRRCKDLKKPSTVLLATYNVLACNSSISKLSTEVGISERQLERIYKQNLGFSPKRFAEVIRFWRSSIYLKMGMLPVDIVDILGFSDQSHFNRIFRRYAGLSPSLFLREQHVGFIQDDELDST